LCRVAPHSPTPSPQRLGAGEHPVEHALEVIGPVGLEQERVPGQQVVERRRGPGAARRIDDPQPGPVEDLLREDPTASIVLYTGYTGSDSMLREAVRAGARGFVLKTSPAPRLTDALRAVAAGGTYVDPELAGRLTEDGEMQRLSALRAGELGESKVHLLVKPFSPDELVMKGGGSPAASSLRPARRGCS